MGKVGSEAIAQSLRESQLNRPVFHLHWLTDRMLRFHEATYKRYNKKARGRPFLANYVWEGDYWARRIRKAKSRDAGWDIVTLVREPIARNISAFFQNLVVVHSYDYRKEIARKGQEAVLSDLMELYRQEYIDRPDTLQHDADPLTWFDVEMKPVFDIDVFASPFSRQDGYAIYRENGVRLLVLKLENVKTNAAEAFREFLGLEDFRLTQRNVAASKGYAALYKAFLNRVSFPLDYVDFVYDSKYSRTYYSPAELAHFRERWIKGAPTRRPQRSGVGVN